jgi:hypothetical protein
MIRINNSDGEIFVLPASTPRVSHPIGEDDVASKPLENLINFLPTVVQHHVSTLQIATQQLLVLKVHIYIQYTSERILTVPPYSVVIQ